MPIEGELKEEIRRGDHAERVLKDPLIQEALTQMRETVYHNIRTSHFKDAEEREELYRMLKAIDSFERVFTDRIKGRTKAQSKLTELLERLKRKKEANP